MQQKTLTAVKTETVESFLIILIIKLLFFLDFHGWSLFLISSIIWQPSPSKLNRNIVWGLCIVQFIVTFIYPWMSWDTITLTSGNLFYCLPPAVSCNLSLLQVSTQTSQVLSSTLKYWQNCCDLWSTTHRLWLLHIIFPYGGHELQVFVLLLQRDHLLLLVLEALLGTGQLVSQPLVLLTQATHLSTQWERVRAEDERAEDAAR